MQAITGFYPDADATSQGVILDATNIVPTIRGSYKAAPTGQPIGIAALPSKCLGSASLLMLDGSTRFLSGTDTGIFESSGTVYSNVSRAGGYAAGDKRWRFGVFGNISLACNGQDVLQASNDVGVNFSNVAGSPKCKVFDVTQGFVMMGATDDPVYGNQPDRWWCSALYDYTDWTPEVATQATTGRLVDVGGAIRAMKALGANFVAYKDRAMFVGTYLEGSPLVWQWQMLPTSIGCANQEAVANVPSLGHIFVGDENFYLFNGSGLPEPIGDGIKDWFFSNLNKDYKNNIYSLVDKRESNVWFFYPRLDSTGNPTAAVIYNYKIRKWGVWTGEVESGVEYIEGGVTFDTSVGTFDEQVLTFDSLALNNTVDIPSYVDANHVVRSLNGVAALSTMTFGDVGDDVFYTTLKRVKPRFLKSPTSASMTNQFKPNEGNALVTHKTATMNDGKFDFLKSARWHRVTMQTTGDCEISGIAYDLVKQGTR